MKVQQFLEHHGLARNPFAEEDAQSDPVFKDHCIDHAFHPAWDKIFGSPGEPSTAIVFGEKGSGKTAMRLQIVRRLAEFNRQHPERRVFVIEYDDFNPFLDRFRDALPARKRRPDRLLGEWKLWDHMDAVLALGVTKLVDRVLGVERSGGEEDPPTMDVRGLDHLQSRDLLLLAACYDQSLGEPYFQRWSRLRRKLGFRSWKTHIPLVLGFVATVTILAIFLSSAQWDRFLGPWPWLLIGASWIPWLVQMGRAWLRARGVARQVRVVHHDTLALCKTLSRFPRDEISGQPLPTKDRTDDRYEMLVKLQGVLRQLGYPGVIVLVDRIDEPHLVNGSAEKMRTLLWPLLDNKLLKHRGLGLKLLLPIELSHYIERENREFYQRARLDKQNMVPSLEWTGAALYDVANERLRACANGEASTDLRDLFDESVNDRRLKDALRDLRVPRNLFKFMHRLLVAHNNAHTESEPVWQISSDTFESVLAVYRRDQDAFDRGAGAG